MSGTDGPYEVLRYVVVREALRLAQVEHGTADVPAAALSAAEIRVKRRAAKALLAGSLKAFQGTGQPGDVLELHDVRNREYFEAVDAWRLSLEGQSRASVQVEFSGLPISSGSRAVVAQLERHYGASISEVMGGALSARAPVVHPTSWTSPIKGEPTSDRWLDVQVPTAWSAIEFESGEISRVGAAAHAARGGAIEELQEATRKEFSGGARGSGGGLPPHKVVIDWVLKEAKRRGLTLDQGDPMRMSRNLGRRRSGRPKLRTKSSTN